MKKVFVVALMFFSIVASGIGMEEKPTWQEQMNQLTASVLKQEFIEEKKLMLVDESPIKAITLFVEAFSLRQGEWRDFSDNNIDAVKRVIMPVFCIKGEDLPNEDAYLALRTFFTFSIECLVHNAVDKVVDKVLDTDPNEAFRLFKKVGLEKLQSLEIVKDITAVEQFMNNSALY